MKIVAYILIAVICSSSCISKQQKEGIVEQVSCENYIIPDSLYSFFAKYFNEKLKPLLFVTNAGDMDLPYFAEEFVITYIVKGFSCQDTAWFTQTREKLIENVPFRKQSKEDNYFIIGSERDMLNSFNTIILREKYQQHLNAPLVLNFHEIFKDKQNLYDKTTMSGLPGDYEIFVIKSGNEYVLPEKYKYDWELLPQKIRHGYSSGMAYSEKEFSVLFWVVAW